MDLIEEALNILKINSVTQTGNIEIVTYLSQLLKKVELPFTIQETTHRGVLQQNLICQIDGQTSKHILFNTHLDTVNPGDPKKWHTTNYNPFNPVIDGDKLYGLGSADVKVDYLCKLKALLKYKGKKFINPLTFVGTYGEEMGLVGCHYFLKSDFVKPTYAFVGEPTELNLVYAHKGMVVIRIEIPLNDNSDQKDETLEFIGESAHGSTPLLGKNAITIGVNELKQLPTNCELLSINGGSAVNMVPIHSTIDIARTNNTPNRDKIINTFELLDEIQQILYQHEDLEYDPPHSNFNIGTVKTEANSVIMRVAFRMLPKSDFKFTLDKIQSELNKVGIEVILERDQPPMYVSKESFIVQKSKEILEQLNIPPNLLTKPTSTEAAHYQQFGAEAVIFGSGRSEGNIHKPNEFNYISQIEKSVLFYEKVIESFCLNEVR